MHTMTIHLHIVLVSGNDYWDTIGFTRPDTMVGTHTGDTLCTWHDLETEDIEQRLIALEADRSLNR